MKKETDGSPLETKSSRGGNGKKKKKSRKKNVASMPGKSVGGTAGDINLTKALILRKDEERVSHFEMRKRQKKIRKRKCRLSKKAMDKGETSEADPQLIPTLEIDEGDPQNGSLYHYQLGFPSSSHFPPYLPSHTPEMLFAYPYTLSLAEWSARHVLKDAAFTSLIPFIDMKFDDGWRLLSFYNDHCNSKLNPRSSTYPTSTGDQVPAPSSIDKEIPPEGSCKRISCDIDDKATVDGTYHGPIKLTNTLQQDLGLGSSLNGFLGSSAPAADEWGRHLLWLCRGNFPRSYAQRCLHDRRRREYHQRHVKQMRHLEKRDYDKKLVSNSIAAHERGEEKEAKLDECGSEVRVSEIKAIGGRLQHNKSEEDAKEESIIAQEAQKYGYNKASGLDGEELWRSALFRHLAIWNSTRCDIIPSSSTLPLLSILQGSLFLLLDFERRREIDSSKNGEEIMVQKGTCGTPAQKRGRVDPRMVDVYDGRKSRKRLKSEGRRFDRLNDLNDPASDACDASLNEAYCSSMPLAPSSRSVHLNMIILMEQLRLANHILLQIINDFGINYEECHDFGTLGDSVDTHIRPPSSSPAQSPSTPSFPVSAAPLSSCCTSDRVNKSLETALPCAPHPPRSAPSDGSYHTTACADGEIAIDADCNLIPHYFPCQHRYLLIDQLSNHLEASSDRFFALRKYLRLATPTNSIGGVKSSAYRVEGASVEFGLGELYSNDETIQHDIRQGSDSVRRTSRSRNCSKFTGQEVKWRQTDQIEGERDALQKDSENPSTTCRDSDKSEIGGNVAGHDVEGKSPSQNQKDSRSGAPAYGNVVSESCSYRDEASLCTASFLETISIHSILERIETLFNQSESTLSKIKSDVCQAFSLSCIGASNSICNVVYRKLPSQPRKVAASTFSFEAEPALPHTACGAASSFPAVPQRCASASDSHISISSAPSSPGSLSSCRRLPPTQMIGIPDDASTNTLIGPPLHPLPPHCDSVGNDAGGETDSFDHDYEIDGSTCTRQLALIEAFANDDRCRKKKGKEGFFGRTYTHPDGKHVRSMEKASEHEGVAAQPEKVAEEGGTGVEQEQVILKGGEIFGRDKVGQTRRSLCCNVNATHVAEENNDIYSIESESGNTRSSYISEDRSLIIHRKEVSSQIKLLLVDLIHYFRILRIELSLACISLFEDIPLSSARCESIAPGDSGCKISGHWDRRGGESVNSARSGPPPHFAEDSFLCAPPHGSSTSEGVPRTAPMTLQNSPSPTSGLIAHTYSCTTHKVSEGNQTPTISKVKSLTSNFVRPPSAETSSCTSFRRLLSKATTIRKEGVRDGSKGLSHDHTSAFDRNKKSVDYFCHDCQCESSIHKRMASSGLNDRNDSGKDFAIAHTTVGECESVSGGNFFFLDSKQTKDRCDANFFHQRFDKGSMLRTMKKGHSLLQEHTLDPRTSPAASTSSSQSTASQNRVHRIASGSVKVCDRWQKYISPSKKGSRSHEDDLTDGLVHSGPSANSEINTKIIEVADRTFAAQSGVTVYRADGSCSSRGDITDSLGGPNRTNDERDSFLDKDSLTVTPEHATRPPPSPSISRAPSELSPISAFRMDKSSSDVASSGEAASLSGAKNREDNSISSRRRWTASEEDAFVTAVNAEGVGNWKVIETRWRQVLKGRKNIQLKDKWINLLNSGRVVLDRHEKGPSYSRGGKLLWRLLQ